MNPGKDDMHVDNFIDGMESEHRYARWFFMLHRFPAVLQAEFHEWIEPYKLFCDYKKNRYRVTGCSRMGDIWLTKNFAQDTGYELRVDVEDCSNWSPTV